MSAKGYKCSPEQIQNMRNAQRASDLRRGFRHSPETCKKISAGQKGKIISPEHREKLSKANIGHVFSDSHKASISASKTKQFCKRGHDKNVEGRTGRECNKCLAMLEDLRMNRPFLSDRVKRKRETTLRLTWRKNGIVNADGTPFTRIDYDRTYQMQQGRCPGCLDHQSDLKMALSADHDHSTGMFRGLLCGRCNTSIGLLRDDVEIFQRLILYLGRK